MSRELLRQLPQVEKALRWPELEPLVRAHSRVEVVAALRRTLESLRSVLVAGGDAAEEEVVSRASLVRRVERTLIERRTSGYRRVINGTGIILHTGLGRAVLPPAAVKAFAENLAGYSIVEVDVETGERSRREDALRPLLEELTGAPAATVVNNNAAATLLILASLARGKEVIISRGQLVEIGGSFRIPDILAESGARLVEVGTTNRTYVEDYRRAITPETGLLLEVHTSNYEIRGFSHHVSLEELVALGSERSIPVVSDLGSGCFTDLGPYGFRREPLVSESVAAGADLVCFSGDKLLGGPQAGIIVGKTEMIERIRKHPLFRTLRVDKVTLTLLEATLRLHREPERVLRTVPALRAVSTTPEAVRERAAAFRERLGPRKSNELRLSLVESTSQMGSGSLPAQEIPSWALALEHRDLSAEQLAEALRGATPPVFSRIHEGRVLVDFRTVLPADESDLERVFEELASADSSRGARSSNRTIETLGEENREPRRHGGSRSPGPAS